MTVCTGLYGEGWSHLGWILGAKTTIVLDLGTADGERFDDAILTTTTTTIDHNLLWALWNCFGGSRPCEGKEKTVGAVGSCTPQSMARVDPSGLATALSSARPS